MREKKGICNNTHVRKIYWIFLFLHVHDDAIPATLMSYLSHRKYGSCLPKWIHWITMKWKEHLLHDYARKWHLMTSNRGGNFSHGPFSRACHIHDVKISLHVIYSFSHYQLFSTEAFKFWRLKSQPCEKLNNFMEPWMNLFAHAR